MVIILNGAKGTSSISSNKVCKFEIEADENNNVDGCYISAIYTLKPDIEAIIRYD